MAQSHFVPCLWGQVECPNKPSPGSRYWRSHWVTFWSCGMRLSDKNPDNLGLWEEQKGNPSSALVQDGTKLSSPQVPSHEIKGIGFTLWSTGTGLPGLGAGCLQHLLFTSVQNKACHNCLLCLESAYPLSHSSYNAGIFQRKRKHPLLSGIFHDYALPRGDLPLQGNFQHYAIFF